MNNTSTRPHRGTSHIMAILFVSRPSNEAAFRMVTKNTATNKTKIFAWDGVKNHIIFPTKCFRYKFSPRPNVGGKKGVSR